MAGQSLGASLSLEVVSMDAPCRALSASVLLFLLIPSLSGSASGQTADTHGRMYARDGMWFSTGFGTGAGSGEHGGLSGNFAIGGTLNQRLLLGVGSSDWRVAADGSVATIGTMDARVQFYPEANGGFFLTGGLGLGYFRFDDSGSGPDVGSGIVMGLGYDARVATNTSITTFINRVWFHTSDPRGNFLQVGVGLTFH
jgi:hypothetical protein